MSKRPEEVKLSQAEGDELIGRIQDSNLSGQDQQRLVKLIRFYFWLTVALQETKLSIKRLKQLLFGKGSGRSGAKADSDAESGGGRSRGLASSSSSSASEPDKQGQQRRGHGRQSASDYTGAERRYCRHGELAAGQRCPLCGHGTLYGLPSGVELRLDGNALISAVRYELEKLRCSGCGEVFTAELPPEAGENKYSARAQAVVALSRYYLGVPFYRLEAFQALLGLPLADATQWDLIQRLAPVVEAIFEQLRYEAAQSPLIYQDDTTARILTLIRENRQRAVLESANGSETERVGMYTTGLVAQDGERVIVLYLTGRAHAGENLAALLTLREPGLAKPLVVSDALSANETAAPQAYIRVHCLAHGLRQFSPLDEAFPGECQRVLGDLSRIYQHEAEAVKQALDAEQRLAYHQQHSGPALAELKSWIEQQFSERLVEPNSSLGKAYTYLLKRWESLTRVLSIPGAPLDNNTVERALKFIIRQRKASLFFASAASARLGSMITSVIASAEQAGVNVLAYLVALQTHAAAVIQQPHAWLPWAYAERMTLRDGAPIGGELCLVGAPVPEQDR